MGWNHQLVIVFWKHTQQKESENPTCSVWRTSTKSQQHRLKKLMSAADQEKNLEGAKRILRKEAAGRRGPPNAPSGALGDPAWPSGHWRQRRPRQTCTVCGKKLAGNLWSLWQHFQSCHPDRLHELQDAVPQEWQTWRRDRSQSLVSRKKMKKNFLDLTFQGASCLLVSGVWYLQNKRRKTSQKTSQTSWRNSAVVF